MDNLHCDSADDGELIDLRARLRRLRPVASNSSTAETFYQAGWNAAIASQPLHKSVQTRRRRWSAFVSGAVCGLLPTVLLISGQLNVPSLTNTDSESAIVETAASPSASGGTPRTPGTNQTETAVVATSTDRSVTARIASPDGHPPHTESVSSALTMLVNSILPWNTNPGSSPVHLMDSSLCPGTLPHWEEWLAKADRRSLVPSVASSENENTRQPKSLSLRDYPLLSGTDILNELFL